MEADLPPMNPDPCDPTAHDHDHHDDSLDSTIHGFNAVNITVIERERVCNGSGTGDGSDSGVELAHCESSLVSCCSGHGKDGSGSETSSTSSRPSKRLTVVSSSGTAKKKVAVNEPTKTPARGKGMAPRTSSVQDRSKSKDRTSKPSTPRPSTLKTSTSSSTIIATPRPKPPSEPHTSSNKRPPRSTSSTRSRTPAITPTDDGRWPSTATCLTRSYRATSATSDTTKPPRGNTAPLDTTTDDGRWPSMGNSMTRSFRGPSDSSNAKRGTGSSTTAFGLGTSLDKYCTLPRRRRERSADNIKQGCGPGSVSRESTPARSLPPYPAVNGNSAARKKPNRTKIYAEVAAQTALTLGDVKRLCEGGTMHECGERAHCAVQTEPQEDEAVVALRHKMRAQTERVQALETELAAERRDKQALQDELAANMHRVQNILGNNTTHHTAEDGSNSLLELESRFETAGQVIIKQENEISELHLFCRTLQRELDASTSAHNLTLQHHRELELETAELTDFLAAEKSTLCEALCEAEARVAQRDSELGALVRVAEQRRQEALALAARLVALEARSRELLLAQGGAASGAAVALTGLSHRVEQLATQLQRGYAVSEQQLEQLDDVVYHNEAYSPDPATPTPPSFLSAIVTAIRSAVTTPQSGGGPHSASHPSTPSDDSLLLDSETEPCLMMDSVLEDVALPDTHSHNLVSVCDSLHSLSQAILQRQRSEQGAVDLDLPGAGDARNLLDQVIDADNMITRLLKVLRCVQLQQDTEVSALRSELQTTRHNVERLSQDVCTLSTSCVVHEHLGLEARLQDTQRQLGEARALLQQHWRDHYQALDTALETLHSCADIVSQSPALAQLQRDLEAASFACAAAPLPPDHNANAGATPLINTTA